MQFFTRFLDFGRRHYEKLALSLALLLLAGAVFGISQASRNAQVQINSYLLNVEKVGRAPVKPVNLAALEESVRMARNPPSLNLSSPHNLLNPVKWLKTPEGGYIKSIKGTEATLDQLQITNITPLLLTISLERYTGTGYMITTTNEAAIYPSPRRIPAYYTLNDTNKPMVVLREVRGAADDPTELVLEVKDSGERISIGKSQPFVRTNAFEADLKFGNKPLNNKRVNAMINLSGEDYKIVAITPGEVVFSAANDKKYTVRYSQR